MLDSDFAENAFGILFFTIVCIIPLALAFYFRRRASVELKVQKTGIGLIVGSIIAGVWVFVNLVLLCEVIGFGSAGSCGTVVVGLGGVVSVGFFLLGLLWLIIAWVTALLSQESKR